ncbi:hypothetical protein D1872_276910 [compost metagenome]
MAEDDRLVGFLCWNVPALHHATAILGGKANLFIGHSFGLHRVREQRGYRWIGQHPGDISMQGDEAKEQEEDDRQ